MYLSRGETGAGEPPQGVESEICKRALLPLDVPCRVVILMRGGMPLGGPQRNAVALPLGSWTFKRVNGYRIAGRSSYN